MSNPFGFIPLPREEEEAADELREILPSSFKPWILKSTMPHRQSVG